MTHTKIITTLTKQIKTDRIVVGIDCLTIGVIGTAYTSFVLSRYFNFSVLIMYVVFFTLTRDDELSNDAATAAISLIS